MFEDSKQRAMVCDIFFNTIGLKHMFDETKSTLKSNALKLGLSHGQRQIYNFAMELWTGEDHEFSIMECMKRLDSAYWFMLTDFLSSYYKPETINEWIVKYTMENK